MTQTRVIFAASYKSCPACYHRSPNTRPVPPAEPCAGSPAPFGPSRSLTMSASRYRSRRNSGNTLQWRCTDTASATHRQYSVGVQPSRRSEHAGRDIAFARMVWVCRVSSSLPVLSSLPFASPAIGFLRFVYILVSAFAPIAPRSPRWGFVGAYQR